MTQSPVGVIQFGSQFSQLIVRKIRELGVYAELVEWEQAAAWIHKNSPPAIVLSGGPKSVNQEKPPQIDFDLLKGLPILGVCYGMQLIAQQFGGEVEAGTAGEFGVAEFEPIGSSLVSGLKSKQVLMSHGDHVVKAPPGFVVTARTEDCSIAAMENSNSKMYGLQWHPEVAHTIEGKEILKRFLFNKAGLEVNWTSEGFVESQVKAIQEKAGDQKVLCAVSGGVDSTVMAALFDRAIGSHAIFVFVDSGLLRKNESQEVARTYQEILKVKLNTVNASNQYFQALKGVTEPELKRKAIGLEFVKVFQTESMPWSDCRFLAQGTLYPDVIESGSSSASKIKSHHNVGGLPESLKLPLIEPFRYLFKDEVRSVGRVLGLPENIVNREPFPGPGLSIRILGEVTKERVAILQEVDAIYRSELKERGFSKMIWQSYAALLNAKTVGVQGDERTYLESVALRAVESTDGMTATPVALPISDLIDISQRITNQVRGVNRVFYDISGKPPATIELE